MLEFKGMSAYPGKVSGKLCIVHNLEEFSHCNTGDVILFNKIKPNAILAKMASAILAIHGGITSHAAIVARESKTPAIVGLKEDILEHVKDGDQIEVDANEGIIILN